ncbi:MFS transporter [Saccharomonospora azurea]|uniref:MFS transporter n=1 Tax=Saccharomonospora azurea TaxID=40988 RepID=UPI00331D45CC
MTASAHVPASRSPGVVPLAVQLGCVFGLGGLGSTAMAVALPAAAAELELSAAQSTWIISLYVVAMAVGTPLYGRLVDAVGVRVPLVSGIALMTLGALGTATAVDFGVLVAARLVQGLGSGVGATLAVAVIGTRFDGHERTRGLALAAGTAGAIGATGPLLGGVTESILTWRGTAAVPVLAALVLIPLWRRVRGPGVGSRVDVVGAVLVALGAAGTIMVVQSPSSGAPVAWTGAVLALVAVPLVVRRSRRGAHVFLPASVLLDARIVRTCLLAGTVPAAWFALLVAVPARLAERGWSPLLVGLTLVPSAVAALLAPHLTVRLSRRVGVGPSLAIAAATAVAALVSSGLGALADLPVPMVAGVALVSVAFSLGQPSLFTVVSELAAPGNRGVAVGFATFVFLLCGSAGSALVGGLMPSLDVHGSLLVLALVCACGGTSAGKGVWRFRAS